MREKNKMYRWLITIWLLISCECFMYAYQPATPPSAWRTTPTLSEDVLPAYQFRSTSAYTPTTSVTVYSPGSCSPYGSPSRLLRGSIDDEEDDPSGDPIGYLDTPIGDALLPLLLMLIAYMILKYRLSRTTRTSRTTS